MTLEEKAEEYIKEHTFFDEEYGVQCLDVVSKTIFKDGVEFGLKQHSHDYLVKTKKLKEKYEKQINELCSLKDEELMCLETEFNTYKSEAKEIIENIIRVTWGEGWNYSLDWKVKAEQFLNE